MKAVLTVEGVSYYFADVRHIDLHQVDCIMHDFRLMLYAHYLVNWGTGKVIKNRATGWTGTLKSREFYYQLRDTALEAEELKILQVAEERLSLLETLENWGK